MPFLSNGTMETFTNYSWPGNVRELENMIKRIVVLGNEKAVLQEFQLRDEPLPATNDEVLDDLEVLTDGDAGRCSLKEIGKRASP